MTLGKIDKATDPEDAGQALLQYKERLDSLLQLSSDWYWEQDEHYRFTLVVGAALPRRRALGPRRGSGRRRRYLGQAQGRARGETAVRQFRFQAPQSAG